MIENSCDKSQTQPVSAAPSVFTPQTAEPFKENIMHQSVANAHEAYQLAQNYIDRLAPAENLFYHAWVCHRYYIFDFLPRNADPAELPALPEKKGGFWTVLFHRAQADAPEDNPACLLATKDGYTACSYGKYGPVLVEKSSGECSIHPLDDPKGLDHYRTLIEHAQAISEDQLL